MSVCLVRPSAECAPSTPPSVMTGRDPRPLLKPDYVASRLNCHVSTVCRMVEAGRLKGIYLMGPPSGQRRGKKGLRIIPESLDDLLSSGPNEVSQFQDEVRSRNAPAVEIVTARPR